MNARETKIVEGREWAKKLGKLHETTVEGKRYQWWGDTFFRGMFAENENGEIKQIVYSGYASKDLTIRKAIACAFGHETFRK